MIDPADYHLLDRYRTDECTPAERMYVETMLLNQGGHAEGAARTQMAWIQALERAAEQLPDIPAVDSESSWSVDAMWSVVAAQLELTRGESAQMVSVSRTPRLRFGSDRSPSIWRSGWRVGLLRATAVLVVASSAIIGVRARRTADARAQAAHVALAAMRIYTTRPGQRADVRLLDGSRVLLGVSSTLRVPEDYDEGSRDLFVEGDAYFEVVHDPQKVFRVHARNTVAQDVGTKFAVRAYGGDPTVTIVVAEGSVSVKPPARVAELRGASVSATPTVKGVVLQSHDLLRVSPAGAMEVRRGVDVSYYLAWTEGRLEFRDAPLGGVATQLSRWYDIDMRLGDPAIASRRITMSLNTESVAEMLSLLEASLDLRAEQKGRTVTLFTH